MNQAHTTKRFSRIFGSVALLLCALAIVLRCLNLNLFYDSVIGYYQSDAILPVLEWIVLTIGAAFGLAFAYLALRKIPVSYKQKTPLAVRIAASAAALGFLALAASTLKTEGTLLQTLLSMGACLYFLLIATNVDQPLPLTLSGLFVIVRLLWAMAESYFDLYVPMNAPSKLILHLGCLSGMLFVVEELRALVSSVRPAFYRFTLVFALLFTGAASIPTLILHYGKILETPDLLPFCIALLTLFLYVLVRLVLLSFFPAPPSEVLAEESASVEESIQNDTEEKAEETPLPEEKSEDPSEEENEPKDE